MGGSGTFDITGNNTFANIETTGTPTAISIRMRAGSTQTFTGATPLPSGTSGNLVSIASMTAATHTLSKSSGVVSCDYMSITNSIATGGATWYAGANSTDGGGNSGWIFTAPPAASGGASGNTFIGSDKFF
jgi:hypothetical protein